MKKNLQFATSQVIMALGITTKLGREVASLTIENLALLESKQLDYGRQNLDEFGSFGVLVRLNDKVSRLKNLHQQDEPNNESLSDTWKDAANYCLIGAVLHAEEKGLRPASTDDAPPTPEVQNEDPGSQDEELDDCTCPLCVFRRAFEERLSSDAVRDKDRLSTARMLAGFIQLFPDSPLSKWVREERNNENTQA